MEEIRNRNHYLHVEAAVKGSAQEQFELAKRLAGRSDSYATSAAIHWLEHAAEGGHAQAGALLEQIRQLVKQENTFGPH